MGGAGTVAAGRGVAGAGLGAVRAGTSMGSAAATAYKLGQETSGSATVGAGLGGVATAAKGAAANRLRSASGVGVAAERGRQAAWSAGTTASPAAASTPATSGTTAAPAWAQRLQGQQNARHRRQMAVHAVRDGDRGGASATPDIKERD
jgi:type IV secretion system protein TrbL